MILNKLRTIAFWSVDFITGSKIRKGYKDLKKIYKKDSTSKYIEKHQKKTIDLLLKYVTHETPFYLSYQGKTDLLDFPVISKAEIQENINKFLSKSYKEKDLFQMSTSGSTGSPFTSYQNIEKKRRVNAETIFFNGMAGYKVGNSLINLRSLNAKSQKSKIKQRIQNEQLINIEKLDKTDIEKLLLQIEKISDKQKSTILSYASTFDAFRNYFKESNLEPINNNNIKGVISSSEILDDKTREFTSYIFNCNCYSRYANMENGMFGQDTPSHPNVFIINEANYFIEILKMDSNKRAELGEVGRIVVTDLYNLAMPMIRYDTGDIGAFTFIDVKGTSKKAITNFGGRQIDMVFDINGTYISAHKISVSFSGFQDLLQFQFIQEGTREYKVLLIVKNDFNQQKELNEKLKSILGKEAKIAIEYVEKIPASNSGKIKYIINNTL